MVAVVMYTTATCPYCMRAKALLARKGVVAEEIRVDLNDEARVTMEQRSGGRRSVPQIFIDEQHIGGCDDLYALDREGKLDPLLKGEH